jgi:hypothetical protein
LYRPNGAKLLALIDPGDRVLDVGGWDDPFPLATTVIDSRTPEASGRSDLVAQGVQVEGGMPARWVRHDLCDHTPWPFVDKSFDFCVCAGLLERLRDPVWVCREMIRVARRGYIEVTSRVAESCRGQDTGVEVGYAEHRWYIDIQVPRITFIPKDDSLFGDWRLSFHESYAANLPDDRRVSWFFWEDEFLYQTRDCAQEELLAFRRRHLPEEVAGTLERLWAENWVLRDQLAQFDDPSGLSLGIVRRLRQASRRHPRLATHIKRLLKVIA